MKLTKEFTSLEKSAVKLTVTIGKKEVEEAYKSTLSKYVKSAQIPGFRKGHVPASVLERKYGESIKADTISELIDESFKQIFDEETDNKPLPYAQPIMENAPDMDVTKDLTYTVTYDIFPKVSVKDFSGISYKEPQVTIGDADIKEELKNMQERNALVVEKKDGVVAKDDIVTINYCELDDNGNKIEGTDREDFVFTVGSGENIYKFDDEVIGMKKGDTKVITKKYAKNDENADLAGTTKKISVTVKAIKVKNLPALDDDLAQDVNEKYKTLDDLKKDISKNLEVAKNRKLAEIKSQSLLEQLVEKNPISVPKSMIDAENEYRWNMMAQQFQTSPEQLEKMVLSSGQTKETMLNEWTGNTEKMLKSRLIIDALLREKNISVTPEEIEAQYAKIAEDGGMTVEEVKEHYKDPKAKEYLIDEAKETKLYDDLYKKVKISKGEKMTFAELFKK